MEMRHGLYQNFRWTGKSVRSVLVWGAIVPISLYYLSYGTEVRVFPSVTTDMPSGCEIGNVSCAQVLFDLARGQ